MVKDSSILKMEWLGWVPGVREIRFARNWFCGTGVIESAM